MQEHESRAGTVFVSYSHDSNEHKDRVRDLANRLRSGGVDCQLDQYEFSPPEGWPKWMARQIAEATFVLVVCTETYNRRVSGYESQGTGLGAAWESQIITPGYESLYRRLTNQALLEKPALGEVQRLAPQPIPEAERAIGALGHQQLASLVLLLPPDGSMGVFPSRSVRASDSIFLELRAEDPEGSAYLAGLRTLNRPGIAGDSIP